MLNLYNLFIRLYYLGIRSASPWNKKAADWLTGRTTVFDQLQKQIKNGDKVIWVHCSSAGEFEQGKPVIEALKARYPHKKILVSFFSPSGYKVAKNYAFADIVTYLPLDTRENAEQFFRHVHPELVIFVKYEFWYHHLAVAAFHHVPILLISANFRQEQVFFKSHGAFFRQILQFFRHIFVQESESINLLQSIGIRNCSISGDTRFDRVVKITEDNRAIKFINEFIGNNKVIIAGSTWPGDEEVLAKYIKQQPTVKLIIVPHEINKKHIASLQSLFTYAILYSSLTEDKTGQNITTHLQQAQTLIIDTVGLLSRLYKHATLTYVGGGFTRDGIHNILEAAVWGKPVIFGPNYKKYREGREMIAAGGAYSVPDAASFKKIADDLLYKENHLQEVSIKARNYIAENVGATEKIMQLVQEKRLLTN